jgi:hypothetical protein
MGPNGGDTPEDTIARTGKYDNHNLKRRGETAGPKRKVGEVDFLLRRPGRDIATPPRFPLMPLWLFGRPNNPRSSDSEQRFLILLSSGSLAEEGHVHSSHSSGPEDISRNVCRERVVVILARRMTGKASLDCMGCIRKEWLFARSRLSYRVPLFHAPNLLRPVVLSVPVVGIPDMI